MSNERKYDEIPGTSASDYQSIDPEGYGALASGGLQNAYNVANTGLAGSSDPFATFLGQTPQIQDLVLGSSSDLGRMLQEQTRQYTQQAVQDVGQEFAGLGSLYSGAARDSAGQRATQAAGQAATQLGQQQLGMAGNLFNQAFGNTQRQQDMFANLLGQNTGIQAQFGAPSYASQQYAARPTFWENTANIIGAASPLVGGLLGGGGGGGGARNPQAQAPASPSVYNNPLYPGGFRPTN